MNRLQFTLFALLLSRLEPAAHALPTMIRLGYPNCSSCHISPQGSGLLNLYGRGIDQAQSLAGGEYSTWEAPVIKDLNWQGRITQDIRIVMQQQDLSTTGKSGTRLFRSRFLYRTATELGKGFRLTTTLMGENLSAPRPSLTYDLAAKPAQVFVNTALLSYRAKPALECDWTRSIADGREHRRPFRLCAVAQSPGLL